MKKIPNNIFILYMRYK